MFYKNSNKNTVTQASYTKYDNCLHIYTLYDMSLEIGERMK